MTATLEQALAVPTVEEARDDILDDLTAEGATATGWPSEAVSRALVEVFARARVAERNIVSQIATASSRELIMQMPDLALRDAWLDFMAEGFYDLERLAPTKATHRFVLTCSPAGGPYPIAPRALRAQDEDGVFFRNTGRLTSDLAAGTQTVNLAPGGSLTELEWECESAGTVGNIPADSALTLVTTLAGVDVTNPEIGSTGSSLLTAGAEAETSESLNARMAARWDRTAVGQLRGSFVFWMFESFEVDGLTCSITKWRLDDVNPTGPGSLDLYIANAAGPATEAELARIDPFLQARWGVGTGVLRVIAAAVRTVPVSIKLYTLGNSDTNIASAQAVLATLQSILPLGSVLYGDDVTKALRSIDDVYHVEHTLEGVTTVLSTNEALVFDATIEEVT